MCPSLAGKFTMNMRICFLVAIMSLAPAGAWAAGGEAAEVQQMFQACINSGGRAASSYNAWVAQNGCICPGQSTGSGQRTCAAGSSVIGGGGGLTLQQQMGVAIGQLGTQMLLEGVRGVLQGDQQTEESQEDAAKAQQVAERRRQAEAEALRQQELTKQRIFSELKGVNLASASMRTDANASRPTLPLKKLPDSTAALTLSQHPEAFTRGFNDASQCYSQNAGPRCAGVAAAQQNTCLSDYRAGYQIGDQQRRQVLEEAYHAGQEAGAKGELANAESDPRALGPCRIQWISAYTNGYGQGRHATSPLNK